MCASSPPSSPRVVFVEDEVLLLGLLTEFFKHSDHFLVHGAYTNGNEALAAICLDPPDIVVIDLQLPDTNGLLIAQKIYEALANPPAIIVLSSNMSPMVVKQLLRLGVRGILRKGVSAAELLAACQQVLRGGVCLNLSSEHMHDLVCASALDDTINLTSRETQILDLVARGRRSKEIADALGLSVRTVDKHRENLMRKLGVQDVGGLVRYAARCGMIPQQKEALV